MHRVEALARALFHAHSRRRKKKILAILTGSPGVLQLLTRQQVREYKVLWTPVSAVMTPTIPRSAHAF